jgi:coenzyme F420-0:L-glutamate ligase/coenzyme F420-1:gamma-L-glutamate ligase
VSAANSGELRIIGINGIPEVQPNDPLGRMIGDAIETSGLGLRGDDVLVVTHKVISKAEGRVIDLRTVTPTDFAIRWAQRFGKDPRQIEVVLNESKRIVRMERGILIAETHHGFICANAGVDQSNVREETVTLLPVDPDRSAEAIRSELAARFGLSSGPGIIVSDSFGRPWRNGIVNVAIGVSGMAPLADYRGMHDAAGYELHVSVMAVADEIASAAELIMNKLDARPVVLLRGYKPPTTAPHGTGQDLIMDSSRDLFK